MSIVKPRPIIRSQRSPQSVVGRVGREVRIRVGTDMRRLREDAGASQRTTAAAAGIDHGFLSQVERGVREPSITTLVSLATVLGADVSIRLFPTTGPRLRDPIQSRILEELLRIAHPGWTRMIEVPVVRPARGVIDSVLIAGTPPVAVCTEIQSELHRLEQLIRWSNEKALSLPSTPFWDRTGEAPRIDRLLIVRSTRANREVAVRFHETLAAAFPTRHADAHKALVDPAMPWPGSSLLWARLEGDVATILSSPPRGVRLGR